MNKKVLIGLIVSAIISSVFSGVVMADEIIPKVTVNDRSVNFYDQAPIVDENQEVFVPVRGIFEAMGATVQWREEDRSVYVKAKDNIKRMILKIDDPIIEQYLQKLFCPLCLFLCKKKSVPKNTQIFYEFFSFFTLSSYRSKKRSTIFLSSSFPLTHIERVMIFFIEVAERRT